MKKTLLTFLSIFAVNYLNAQAPTITKDDFVKPGDNIAGYYDYENTVIVDKTGGTNREWDFSDISYTDTDTARFISPIGTPNASKYPTATAALPDVFDVDSYGYLEVNNSGAYVLNYIGSSIFSGIGTDEYEEEYFFEGPMKPAPKVMQFPTTYNTSWINEYTFEQNVLGQVVFDSVGFKEVGRDSIVADAWGKLITPIATYPKALRVVTYSKYTTYLSTFNGTWSGDNSPITIADTSYQWWVPGQPYQVFEIVSMSGATNETQSAPQYFAAYYKKLSGVDGIAKNHFGTYNAPYPNPAKDELFIPSADKLISFTDASGQEFEVDAVATAPETLKVELLSQKPGLYFAKVEFKGKARMEKITISY